MVYAIADGGVRPQGWLTRRASFNSTVRGDTFYDVRTVQPEIGIIEIDVAGPSRPSVTRHVK